jgi:hypothetical protein
MRQWTGTSLPMYVDDGLIFATSNTSSQMAENLQDHRDCVDWLTEAGLDIESDILEIIFFDGIKTWGHHTIIPSNLVHLHSSLPISTSGI